MSFTKPWKAATSGETSESSGDMNRTNTCSGKMVSHRPSLEHEYSGGQGFGSGGMSMSDAINVANAALSVLSRVALGCILSFALQNKQSNPAALALGGEAVLAVIAGFALLCQKGPSGFVDPFRGQFGPTRVKNYSLIGMTDAISWALKSAAYRFVSPTMISIIALMKMPLSSFFMSVFLRQGGMSLVEKLTQTMIFCLCVVFMFDMRQDGVGVDLHMIIGLALMMLSLVSGSLLTVFNEVGTTTDRPMAEIVFFKAAVGTVVLLVPYVLLTSVSEMEWAFSSWWMVGGVVVLSLFKLLTVFNILLVDSLLSASLKPVSTAAIAVAEYIGLTAKEVEPTPQSIAHLILLLIACALHQVAKSATPTSHALVFLFHRETHMFCVFRHKRGSMKGMINGSGGKVNAGEHTILAAWRHVARQTHLDPSDADSMHLLGTISYVWATHFVFLCPITTEQRAEVCETSECIPQWLTMAGLHGLASDDAKAVLLKSNLTFIEHAFEKKKKTIISPQSAKLSYASSKSRTDTSVMADEYNARAGFRLQKDQLAVFAVDDSMKRPLAFKWNNFAKTATLTVASSRGGWWLTRHSTHPKLAGEVQSAAGPNDIDGDVDGDVDSGSESNSDTAEAELFSF